MDEPRPTKVRPRRRNWLSFRLRSLLLVMLLVAGGLGYARWRLSWYVQQEAAAQYLIENGAQVSVRIVGPEWLRRQLGDQFLVDVVAVKLEHQRVDDEILQNVGKLLRLERLYLAGTATDDEGLRHLRPLKNLQRLSLWSTRVTDTGLQELKHLTALEVLDIQYMATEKSFQHLRHLPRLKKLVFSKPLSDEGARWLSHFPKLELTSVSATGLTDQGLSDLSRFAPTLETLRLRDSAVTDAGFASAPGWPRLKHLSITKSPEVTNRLFEVLPQSIEYLRLYRTQVTLEGIVDHFGDVFDQVSYTGSSLELIGGPRGIRKPVVSLSLEGEVEDAEAIQELSSFKKLGIYHSPQNDGPFDERFVDLLLGLSQLEEVTLQMVIEPKHKEALRRLKHLRIREEREPTR